MVKFFKIKQLYHKRLFLPSCAVFEEKEKKQENRGAWQEQNELAGLIFADKGVLR